MCTEAHALLLAVWLCAFLYVVYTCTDTRDACWCTSSRLQAWWQADLLCMLKWHTTGNTSNTTVKAIITFLFALCSVHRYILWCSQLCSSYSAYCLNLSVSTEVCHMWAPCTAKASAWTNRHTMQHCSSPNSILQHADITVHCVITPLPTPIAACLHDSALTGTVSLTKKTRSILQQAYITVHCILSLTTHNNNSYGALKTETCSAS
jgi:hypothetical protein